MKKIGIFYGSTTGTTEAVAAKLAKYLDVELADVHNVAESSPSMLGDYENLVFGTSTWGSGDLQEDWYDFIDGVQSLDLSGKKIAIFGCGDETMSDTFCSAVGEIYKRLQDTGATFVGDYDTVGYTYDHSAAEVDGRIIGLLLDEVNHPELTDLRLRGWADEVKKSFGV